MKNSKEHDIGKIILLLVFIQLLLFGIQQCLFVFFSRTDYIDSAATMFAMIVITLLFIFFKKNKAYHFHYFLINLEHLI